MFFNPRQQADYSTTLRNLVRDNEAFRENVYQPNDHVPTIGYGFTFVRKGAVWALYEHLDEDLLAIGRPLTGPQNALLTDITDARNAGNSTLADTLIAEFSISFGTITEGDAQTLFQRDVDYRGTLINSRFRSVLGQVEGDALFGRLAGSTEMMAVFDIAYYRGHEGLNPDLIIAMSRNDRAAAWYELRYRELPPNVQPGHPPRNYRDAELFSLYDTPGTATLPEAQAIYRLYTDNRTSIESYETSFPPPPDVSSVITALRPAKNTLLEWLRTSKGIGLNADAYSGTDVLLASELGQTLDGSFGDYRNAANVLIGDNGTDHLMGGAGDDLLFGSGDIDWLEGGSGNDTLYGNDGIAGDRLEGGAGNDTYYADAGDIIRDSDGKGSVILDDNTLGTATRRKGEFAYRDSDGNAFVLIGSDLRINGNLLIEGFTSGDLGIVLKEDERDPNDPTVPDDPTDPNDPANPGAPGDTGGPGGRDGDGGLGGAGATADGFGAAEIGTSPLILDLDGDGVETLGINAGITFDHDRNGFAEATGNEHRQVGSFTRTDGTSASMDYVWFKTNAAYSVNKNLVALDGEPTSCRQACRALFCPQPSGGGQRSSLALKLGRPLGHERFAKAIRARLGIRRNSGSEGGHRAWNVNHHRCRPNNKDSDSESRGTRLCEWKV